jgi:hypothetical protein
MDREFADLDRLGSAVAFSRIWLCSEKRAVAEQFGLVRANGPAEVLCFIRPNPARASRFNHVQLMSARTCVQITTATKYKARAPGGNRNYVPCFQAFPCHFRTGARAMDPGVRSRAPRIKQEQLAF